MTDDTPADDIDPTIDGDPVAPLTNRLGRLAVIVAGVVLIAIGFNAVLSKDVDPEEADAGTLGIKPAELPRGALAGEPAPLFALDMFAGDRFDLAAHVSEDERPIVLNFWASWCFPCRTEMPEFDEVAKANPDVQFIGIAIEDSLDPAIEFAEEIQVSYPLGFDTTGEIGDAYPHVGLPTTFFLNGDGTVARQFQGQVNGEMLQALIDFDFG